MLLRAIAWPHEQNALAEFLVGVYGADEAALLVERYAPSIDRMPQDCLVIDGETPGTLAALGLVIPRAVRIEAGVLPAAEIALLGAREDAAAQGAEAAILDALHDRITAQGAAVVLAFGPPALYERWQYEYAAGLYFTSYESRISTADALKAGSWNPTHSYERRTADRLRAQGSDVTVRRFYLADLPAVEALYAEASAQGHYLIARTADTWTGQLDHLEQIGYGDPDDFVVAEVGDQITAYMRVISQASVNPFCTHDATRLSVIEVGGSHPDSLEALLNTAASLAHALNEPQIGLFIHPDSPFMGHALARGATRRQFTGAALMRLHDLLGAMSAMIPTLETRRLNSRFCERAFQIVISTEHDEVVLDLGTGKPTVVELELPASVLVRLLTGWYGLDHVTMGYHERHADLLRVLFPLRWPMIGIADLI